jgi:hypothetical protein
VLELPAQLLEELEVGRRLLDAAEQQERRGMVAPVAQAPPVREDALARLHERLVVEPELLLHAVEEAEALRGRQHVGEDDPGGEATLVGHRVGEPRVELAAAVLRDAVRDAAGVGVRRVRVRDDQPLRDQLAAFAIDVAGVDGARRKTTILGDQLVRVTRTAVAKEPQDDVAEHGILSSQ